MARYTVEIVSKNIESNGAAKVEFISYPSDSSRDGCLVRRWLMSCPPMGTLRGRPMERDGSACERPVSACERSAVARAVAKVQAELDAM